MNTHPIRLHHEPPYTNTLTINTMNTNPIHSDQRWTVTREYTGAAKPQFVVRFCGDWIDSRTTYPAAVTRAVGAKAVRDGALVVVEIRNI